ncbi:hypothetical protein, partial [Muriicola sp. Z0-33]|uniref:hypothetical protein n=1 Tax=Muriicola sp. Z0-33 TaxID=2816957 RepID=UPI0022378667
VGLLALLVILTKLRFNVGLLALLVILTKLRFENSPNKKTLKRAWRFFLLNYSFVTSAGLTSLTLVFPLNPLCK